MANTKTMERYCELADGAKIEADAGCTGRDLWIMFRDNTSMTSALNKLKKTDVCTRIVWHYPGGEDVFEGYVEIVTIKMDVYRRINVRLRRTGDVGV